jgi:transposase
MRRTEQLQGLRMLKLRETLTRWESGRLSQLEAAEILGMSERTFRRWARRFEADGQTGLTDHRVPGAPGTRCRPNGKRKSRDYTEAATKA